MLREVVVEDVSPKVNRIHMDAVRIAFRRMQVHLLPDANENTYKHCFIYFGPTYFNLLLQRMRETPNLNIFRKAAKNSYIAGQNKHF